LLAPDIAHLCVEEGIQFGSEEGGEDEGLPEVRRVGVEILGCADAAVVGVGVGGAWLVIEVGKGEEDVCPVLLEHGIYLVEDEELNRGQKIAVKVLGTVKCG